LGSGEVRRHTVRSRELELLYSEGEIFYWSSDLLLTKVRCNSHYTLYGFHVVDAGSEHAHVYANAGFAAVRLLYSIPCEDAPVGR
jgi:hypothetical protein